MSISQILNSRWSKLLAALVLLTVFVLLCMRNVVLDRRAKALSAVNQQLAEENEHLAGSIRDQATVVQKNGERLELLRKEVKERIVPLSLEVERLSKENERQENLYRSETGVEVIETADFVLYYPPALRWLISRLEVLRMVEAAQRTVTDQLGKFKRKVRVRLVVDSPKKGEATITRALFRRHGDEILVWPHGMANETLVHEFTHAWVFQLLDGKYPTPLDEGLAYAMEGRDPQKMFDWLTSDGPVSKEAMVGKLPADEKQKVRTQASTWLVFYYLHCIHGLEWKEIVRKDPKELPDPRAIVDVVWAHSQLLVPSTDSSRVLVSNPWLDLAELGPITVAELRSFKRADTLLLRKFEATRELLLLDRSLRKVESAKAYWKLKDGPDIQAVWRARRSDVFNVMCREGELGCLSYQWGVSLRCLAITLLEPLVGLNEFVRTDVGIRLRNRSEATIWARSYFTTVCEGEPLSADAPKVPLVFDPDTVRDTVIKEALTRLGKELWLKPMKVFKLR